MTAIAVIAVLTAMAIPSYQLYMLKARMHTARVYVDSYTSQITDFYSAHGRFPTNSDLGVSSAVPSSVAGYLYPPYVAYVTFEPQTNTGTQCPYTINTGYFSNYNGDYYADGTSRYVVFYNFIYDNNGTMKTQCAYYEFNPLTSQTTNNDIFRDCLNSTDPSNSSSSIMTVINSSC